MVGSGRGALIGLWIPVSVMCSQGIVAMCDRFGLVRSNPVGLPLGVVATALLVSAFLGWKPLLQPIASAMAGSGQPVSLDRAAIVGVGAIMMLKWAIGLLSYLPRRELHS